VKSNAAASIGAALWLVLTSLTLAGFVQLSLIDVLFLLAPLVVVPLGMALLPVSEQSALLHGARLLQPFAALALVTAMLLPPGWLAAVLVAPWLLLAGLVGLTGLWLMVTERSLRPSVLVPAAAMGFLVIGAGWIFISRAGLLLGYSPDIVELTGVHFHFAGFAATLMAALTVASVSGRQAAHRIAVAGSYLIVIGIPLVAAGLALRFHVLGFGGAGLLASGVILVAAVTVVAVVPRAPKRARVALTVSALSVFLPMVLAVMYTAAPVLGTPALSLPDMAATHGVLNSLAFSVAGLLGWRLAAMNAHANA
jgi:hypothetical protein